jgi:catechol 2,3-dioxygenase-like lactoylglutathione lyase family enzyme
MKESRMLSNKDAVATLAVKNLQTAKSFYRDKLGLELVAQEGDVVQSFRSGATTVLVYRSEFAGTNKATAATWLVGDEVDEIVRTLKAKGVVFEHYDMPGMTLQGDVHVAGDMRVAWFKDPDGNVISIVSG